MSDDYSPVRRAAIPMALVGFLVGDLASEDPNWPLYGMGLAFCVWFGWVLVQIIVNAAVEVRRARQR